MNEINEIYAWIQAVRDDVGDTFETLQSILNSLTNLEEEVLHLQEELRLND